MNIILPDWAQLERLGVNEHYATGRCLAINDIGAEYECVVDGVLDPTRRFWLIDLEQPGASEHLTYWQAALAFDHPHLIRVVEAAPVQLQARHMAFCVLEAADETLQAGLEERALEPNEGLQILESVAAALEFLHAHDYVHGSVEPLNILAVGEKIKLSADAIPLSAASVPRTASENPYEAPEVRSAGYSPASDMWSLSAVLFRALTHDFLPQNAFFHISSLPAPFATVLLRCLEQDPAQRWSAHDVLREINFSRQTKAPSVAPPAARIPTVATAAPLSVAPAAPLPSPAPVYERRRSAEVDEPAPHSWTRYAIVGGVLLIGLLWLLFRKGPEHPRTQPPTPLPASTSEATPARAPLPEAAPSKPHPSAPSSSWSSTVNWRVVAYTFNRAADAAHKATTLNAKTPGLHAEVFSPNHGRSPYLVCLGGWMSDEQARQLRRRAIAAGLPHDTYAQNFRR